MKRNVWITGASGGIGSAIARRFARDSWGVLLQYYHGEQRAQALEEELRATGADVMSLSADVADARRMRRSLALDTSMRWFTRQALPASSCLLIPPMNSGARCCAPIWMAPIGRARRCCRI